MAKNRKIYKKRTFTYSKKKTAKPQQFKKGHKQNNGIANSTYLKAEHLGCPLRKGTASARFLKWSQKRIKYHVKYKNSRDAKRRRAMNRARRQRSYFTTKRDKRKGDYKKNIGYLEQSIALDSQNAHAYASLATTYTYLCLYSPYPAKESYEKAKDTALKALEIDNLLAEVYLAIGVD